MDFLKAVRRIFRGSAMGGDELFGLHEGSLP
jgi:hypothetical protein